MRITTYQKKLEAALKYRPRFESQNVAATVTLTGNDNLPMIDVELGAETTFSVNVDEARLLANWIKQVAR